MESNLKLEKYRKRLTMLGVVGLPFYAAFALGILAYFEGNALIPFLENEATAFLVFAFGGVGAAINLALSYYHVYQIKALEKNAI